MPLIHSKSKSAFSHNVGAEMDAGKPQAQSLAIAYNIKKRNQRKKMAEGGAVENEKLAQAHSPEMPENPILKEMYRNHDPKSIAHAILKKKELMAHGGVVIDDESGDSSALDHHAVDTMDGGEEELKMAENPHDLFDSEPTSDEYDAMEPHEKQKVMLQAVMERMHAKARGRL